MAVFTGLTKSPGRIFYHSYIFSYMLILGLTVGSLGLLMLQHLTGGAIWGMVIRRPPGSGFAEPGACWRFSFIPIWVGDEIPVLRERQ